MLARHGCTEKTHDSTRAINYNTVNIQKCKWLSERCAEQKQYAHVTTRRATAKHHKKNARDAQTFKITMSQRQLHYDELIFINNVRRATARTLINTKNRTLHHTI